MSGIMSDHSAAISTISLAAALAFAASTPLTAQELEPVDNEAPVSTESETIVYGTTPDDLSGMEEGPAIKGLIINNDQDQVLVASDNGQRTALRLSSSTQIRSSKGLLGLERTRHSSSDLYSGLPISVETVVWNDSLVAKRIKFRGSDLKTANMIHAGTEHQFAQQSAATQALRDDTQRLRARFGGLDQYDVMGTSNVYFDTGKSLLSEQAERELCMAAEKANTMENAKLLVVGYTDSVGSHEYNQGLSERRAGSVVNHLQQACGWKPWRMLNPTGMSEEHPVAPNTTMEGKAQNRRVSVNILVSKAIQGL